ncbi:MAG: rod shape-determining protein MreC [Lachnospiraceae bacterium]|nr:rod shape-determining protein MreC [Lachnospiraceae bacterium]
MKKKSLPEMRPKHIFFLLAGVCLILIIVSSVSSATGNVLRNGVSTILMPMQKGFNFVGSTIFGQAEELAELKSVQEENEALKEQVAELTEQNTRYQLQLAELEEYQELLELADQYPDYETVGAHIIGKNSDSWYTTFYVDKGANDGITEDMNVIADGGLVGIVTAVTDTTATITAIIDDNRNVGAMGLDSKDACIVSGDLTLYEEGKLTLSKMEKDADIEDGDKIVTSNTSDLYLPGILIGYADGLEVDSNNLTKSGYLIPVVDFSHLDTVLIITTTKEAWSEEED